MFGGVTGAISHSIVWVSGNIVGAEKWEISIVQGILHGWSGALITTLQGGNPIKGAISGFASSITAASIQSIGGGKVATLIGGTLSGGVGAYVVGGDFYQGATFGLISTSLNHLAHEVKQQTLANVTLTVTDEIVGNTTFSSLGQEYESPLNQIMGIY